MVFCIWTTTSPLVQAESPESLNAEGLRECGIIHHTDIHTLKRPHAEYFNNQCSLSCFEDKTLLSHNSINEGFQCPGSPSAGVCRSGVCVNEHDEALQMCAKLHRNQVTNWNPLGTGFLNDSCALKCVTKGFSVVNLFDSINEGKLCQQNLNGVSYICNCLNLI